MESGDGGDDVVGTEEQEEQVPAKGGIIPFDRTKLEVCCEKS